MITFEEFFIKKKIDLSALKMAELGLYEEFKTHYGQMGEKSFDHTKKYWFNKLRKVYQLAEPTIKLEKNPAKENTIAVASVESTPTKTTGFKPRFKATTIKPADDPTQDEDKIKEQTTALEVTKPIEIPIAEEQATDEQSATLEPPVTKPAAFKPRFKAGITKPAENPSAEEQTTTEQSATLEPPATKPAGFKPRFKAGITKPAENPIAEEQTTTEQSATLEPPATKPAGFKPRFKAGITKNNKDQSDQ